MDVLLGWFAESRYIGHARTVWGTIAFIWLFMGGVLSDLLLVLYPIAQLEEEEAWDASYGVHTLVRGFMGISCVQFGSCTT